LEWGWAFVRWVRLSGDGTSAIGSLLVTFLLVAQPARAQAVDDSGMGKFGLNVDFALPLGNAAGGPDGASLSDAINFAVPFGVQVGYRIGGPA
jgi:hypothetical protein